MDLRESFDRIYESDQIANYPLDETFQQSAEHLLRKEGDQYNALLMKFFIKGARSQDVQEQVEHLRREVERVGLDQVPNVSIRIGGGEISSDIEQIAYFTNLIESFFSSLAINFIVLLLFWRRFSYALLAIIPLLMSASVTLGVMVLFGAKLNVLNLTVGMIIVGLGIDYPIHIIERFKEEGNVQKVLSRMGPNIFGAALTTIVGFAASMILAMPIAHRFGALVAIAIFLAYVASIFILPILLPRSSAIRQRGNQ